MYNSLVLYDHLIDIWSRHVSFPSFPSLNHVFLPSLPSLSFASFPPFLPFYHVFPPFLPFVTSPSLPSLATVTPTTIAMSQGSPHYPALRLCLSAAPQGSVVEVYDSFRSDGGIWASLVTGGNGRVNMEVSLLYDPVDGLSLFMACNISMEHGNDCSGRRLGYIMAQGIHCRPWVNICSAAME